MLIKLFIIDDHEVVRQGLRIILEKQGFKVIGMASNAEAGIKSIKTLALRDAKPDIVLVDIRLEKMDGVELTRKITCLFPNIKVLGLTAYQDSFFASSLIQSGAKGCLTKGTNVQELLKAIRKVYFGDIYVDYCFASQMATPTLYRAKDFSFRNLSSREKQITIKLIEGQKPKKIAYDLNLSVKTIHSYRHRIFRKLKIKNDVGLMQLAVDKGLLNEQRE